MRHDHHIQTIMLRRNAIRNWLFEEAPYTEHDQSHLDSGTPAEAYWQHGYQAALDDIVNLLAIKEKDDSEGTAKRSEADETDE